MDIAGNDLIIMTPMRVETQREFMTSYIRHLWPRMVLEEADGEIFFYKDAEFKQSWDSVGRTEENAGQMVHVLPGEGHVTIVHEGLDEKEVRTNFNLNRCFV